MNIHEYQAKEILKKFGATVPNGTAIFSLDEIDNKLKNFKMNQLVLKAQIHAGGRGKAGGIKIVNNIDELKKEAKNLFGKTLVTHQTGPQGKKVKRLYVEESCNVEKEFYLSCLVDRSSSKIAFISSSEGGMDIEKIAKENSKKIVTVRVGLTKTIDAKDIDKIIQPFNLSKKVKTKASDLIKVIYKILTEKDASLIEINRLVLTKN